MVRPGSGAAESARYPAALLRQIGLGGADRLVLLAVVADDLFGIDVTRRE